jgi:hypothetical protein
METSTVIVILAIILFILIVLNNITIILNTSAPQGGCSQTMFGCCPDGINSKINFYGTNCPGYKPYPGYPIVPTPIPPPPPGPGPIPPKPIGGCAGTRYGCCPNNYTPKIDQQGSNCNLNPMPGGCAGTRYGCCPNNYTPKINQQGSNCIVN